MWWYADVLDAQGNGVVLIWSFGLPFLPGYASDARAGRGQKPRDRPSLNVSIYRQGRLAFYLLQELEPGDVSWTPGSWTFGASTFNAVTIDEVHTLQVELDCSIPASSDRLRGTVVVTGAPRVAGVDDIARNVHDWAPLTGAARGHVSLRAGTETYDVDGRGYHDCNGGSRPLHETGIWAWTWGRIPAPGADRIYYLLWPERDAAPEAHGIEIDAGGILSRVQLDVEVSSWRLGLAGLRHPRRLELFANGREWLTSERTSVVDDGPFYVRNFIRSGDGTVGIAEYCRPDRVDLAIHRPLVRMRVQRPKQNSVWLPLFSGARDGRIGRLLRQFGTPR